MARALLLAIGLLTLGCNGEAPSPPSDARLETSSQLEASARLELGSPEARPADRGAADLAPDLKPTPKCSDGTPVGSCSKQKPLRCNSSLKLEHDCLACGCPGFEACNPTTKGCAPVTVTLTPIADAHVVEPTPAQNFGSELSLKVGRAWNGLSDGFLDFDLSTVPNQATIDSATLTVEVVGWSGVPLPVTVSLVAAPWAEQQIIWSNAPAIKPSATASRNLIFGANPIDARVMVGAWLISPIVPHGFRIRTSSTVNISASLASREHATAGMRPRLSITYR